MKGVGRRLSLFVLPLRTYARGVGKSSSSGTGTCNKGFISIFLVPVPALPARTKLANADFERRNVMLGLGKGNNADPPIRFTS